MTSTASEQQKPSRGGAPRGNSNALKAGRRYAVSTLPRGCESIENARNRIGRDITAALQERDGTAALTVWQAACIQTLIRHETRVGLLSRWLRLEGDKISVLERAALTRDICAASEARDGCLKRLGLDRANDAQPWAIVSLPTASPGPALFLPENDRANITTDEPGSPRVADAAESTIEGSTNDRDSLPSSPGA